MFLRTESITSKKLIGKHVRTNMLDNKTPQLWASFMPHRNEIQNRTDENFISMQLVDSLDYFKNFSPATFFEKWASVEVSDLTTIPNEMESFLLPAGMYAVFLHKGTASDAPKTFGYIFGTWLPQSEFELDHRPHFEVIGAKYSNNSPDSEEEVWIPIKLKAS
jgi:AraC family transcriptional regulator